MGHQHGRIVTELTETAVKPVSRPGGSAHDVVSTEMNDPQDPLRRFTSKYPHRTLPPLPGLSGMAKAQEVIDAS
jgi:hypothetical protein